MHGSETGSKTENKVLSMIINILGTDYEIIMDVSENNDTRLKMADAYCDFTTKQIKVSPIEPDENTFNKLEVYKQKVIRHEIVHAFMYESGLDNNSEWGRDETLIDWIAIQLPKLMKAAVEAGTIE